MIDVGDVDLWRRSDVAFDAITHARAEWAKANRRPAALTAREALAALQFEALLVWVAASNLRTGVELSDEDYERLSAAMCRIESIADEVLG